jgi:DNA-binding MarR family transcriptional regulator/GNAT superfamily N-acetyltransferase
MAAADPALAARIAAVRRFNRFYTRRIGVLQEGLHGSAWSLTEGRVLYELAQRAAPTAAELARDLGLDPGYLSRILKGFEARGELERRPCARDGRQTILALTEAGRAAFAAINGRARNAVGALLDGLPAAGQDRLVAAMATIEDLLGAPAEPQLPYLLRPHQPGDLGWIIHRQGVLYHEEYGWDASFEALVAAIAAQFVQQLEPRRERCWIAERAGEVVGAVFLVRQSDEVAKLRLLYVEPKARGLGIGRRLVAECTRFARQAGYRRITLWTQSILGAARRLYQAEGYRLVESASHISFGQALIGETWQLELDPVAVWDERKALEATP